MPSTPTPTPTGLTSAELGALERGVRALRMFTEESVQPPVIRALADEIESIARRLAPAVQAQDPSAK